MEVRLENYGPHSGPWCLTRLSCLRVRCMATLFPVPLLLECLPKRLVHLPGM